MFASITESVIDFRIVLLYLKHWQDVRGKQVIGCVMVPGCVMCRSHFITCCVTLRTLSALSVPRFLICKVDKEYLLYSVIMIRK